MKSRSNVSPIMRSQENYIVLFTKAIIEAHVAVKRYSNYNDRIILKNTIRVHYTTETISKITVESMNYQKAVFH